MDENITTIDDIDHYREGSFRIEVKSKRFIGAVMSVVKKQLVHHNLEDCVAISREQR